jgi:hypothetical protein
MIWWTWAWPIEQVDCWRGTDGVSLIGHRCHCSVVAKPDGLHMIMMHVPWYKQFGAWGFDAIVKE